MTSVLFVLCDRVTALRALDECERNYHALPPTHKKMIPGNIKAIEESKVCIDCNALVIKEITKFCNEMCINKSYTAVNSFLSG